jgi:hypothetical protein
MAKKPCARCEKPFEETNLLYTDAGQICVDCDAELEDEKAHEGKIRSLIISGPVISIAGLAGMVGGVIPLLGLVFLATTPFLGLFGLVQGIRAILASMREPKLSQGQKTGLLVSGALTTFWCLGVMVGGTGMLILALLGMAAMSLY